MGSEKIRPDTLQLQKWLETYNYNKNKVEISLSESMISEKKHTFFFGVSPCLGPTLADEDTNRAHAGALLPFSYKRGGFGQGFR